MPAYEYRRATWDEVTKLGPRGWRLVAFPPVQEVRQVLGQPQVGEPLYTMEREVPAVERQDPHPGQPPVNRVTPCASPGAIDAALARAGELRMTGMSSLGALGVAADEMCREDGQSGLSGEAEPC